MNGNGMSIVPAGKKIRYKCSCGNIADTKEGVPCKKCGAPQEENCGYYKLYRMGNALGFMSAFTINVDGEPFGRIGNKQTCWIKLPYGQHTISVTAGFNKRGNEVPFMLTPDHPLEGGKVHIRVGAIMNSYVIEPAPTETIPD